MFLTNEIKRKILMVEDDKILSEFISTRLTEKGFVIENVYNGLDALKSATSKKFSLILLDINLPQKDGFSVLKSIRLRSIYTPAIVMTNHISEENQFLTYHNRANIFHPKPLKFDLLIEQINLLTQDEIMQSVIDLADMHIDYAKKIFRIKNEIVNLTPKEFNLLFLFMNYPNIVLSRKKILKTIDSKWLEVEDHSIDRIVSRLRLKLKNHNKQSIVETIYSIGFKLNIDNL